MRHPIKSLVSVAGVLVAALSLGSAWATGAQFSTMTYQGRLSESGSPVTGNRDVQLYICDAVSGGTCSPSAVQSVSVQSGVFRTTFTSVVTFSSATKWVEVHVGPVGGGLTLLSPREQLTAVPFGDFARRAGELTVNPNGGGFVTAEEQGVALGVGNQDYHSMWANGDFYFGGTIFGTPPAARLHVSSTGATFSQAVLLVSSGSSPGQELFVVKGDGRVGINTTTPQTWLHIVNPLAAGNPAVVISRHGTTGGGQGIHFKHSGGTQGAPTAGANGDPVLFIVGAAHDGSQYRELAGIESTIDGPVSAGSVPGNLRFYTARAGVGGIQEKMRITSTGQVGIGGILPAATLHVSSANASPGAVLLKVSSGTAAGQEILETEAGGRTTLTGALTIKSTGTAPGMALLSLAAGGGNRFTIDANGHMDAGGPAPGTLGAGCGASASHTGNDSVGTITLAGAGITASCGFLFNTPWSPNIPTCVSDAIPDGAQYFGADTTSSSVTFHSNGTYPAGAVIRYICMGYRP